MSWQCCRHCTDHRRPRPSPVGDPRRACASSPSRPFSTGARHPGGVDIADLILAVPLRPLVSPCWPCRSPNCCCSAWRSPACWGCATIPGSSWLLRRHPRRHRPDPERRRPGRSRIRSSPAMPSAIHRGDGVHRAAVRDRQLDPEARAAVVTLLMALAWLYPFVLDGRGPPGARRLQWRRRDLLHGDAGDRRPALPAPLMVSPAPPDWPLVPSAWSSACSTSRRGGSRTRRWWMGYCTSPLRRGLALAVTLLGEPGDRLGVTVDAAPDHLMRGHVGEEGVAPEGFPRVDVADVHLDDGDPAAETASRRPTGVGAPRRSGRCPRCHDARPGPSRRGRPSWLD